MHRAELEIVQYCGSDPLQRAREKVMFGPRWWQTIGRGLKGYKFKRVWKPESQNFIKPESVRIWWFQNFITRKFHNLECQNFITRKCKNIKVPNLPKPESDRKWNVSESDNVRIITIIWKQKLSEPEMGHNFLKWDCVNTRRCQNYPKLEGINGV